jgi:fatty acid synthase, animal type
MWVSYGVRVTVNTCDISSKSGCKQLIRDSMKLGSVGGIFNLAVVLRDNIFENQTAQNFVGCMSPKAIATKYLDEISRLLCPELKHFVVFSSVSCGRGNAGQSNYGMANSVMERIIEQRHKLGLPAKAIQWGAVGEVGLVADLAEDKVDMEIGGTLQQRISSCLEKMDLLLVANEPLLSCMVVAEKRHISGGKGNILDVIMNAMSIRDVKSLSMETTLSELGMDSLLTVEIQQTLEREHDLVIAAQELRSMTLAQLVKLANNKDSDEKPEESKIIKGIEMLLRNFGEEINCEKMILELKTLSKKSDTKILIVPGIESTAGSAWFDIAHQMNSPVYVLQSLTSSWQSTELDEIYDAIIKHVLNLFKNDDKFMLVGYSFGSLIALKLAKALEDCGKSGKVVLIDGSPKYIKALAAANLSSNFTHEQVESLVMTNAVKIFFGQKSLEKLKIVFAEATWKDRVEKLLELSNNLQPYSDQFVRIMLNGFLNRTKIAIQLDVEKFQKLSKTPITLVRPLESSIQNVEDDYGLRLQTEKHFELMFIEGNHSTILENPKLVEILNSNLKL